MVTPGSEFRKLYDQLVEQGERTPSHGILLALDPGVTTGFAVFDEAELIHVGQNKDDDIGSAAHYIETQVEFYKADAIVIEDYRVYRWKQKQHAWSDLHTPRLIGAIEKIAYDKSLPLIKQPAHIGKGFCTDAKLKHWGMWHTGMRHGRDAIRHGCYYTLFGGRSEWHEKSKNPHNPQLTDENKNSTQ